VRSFSLSPNHHGPLSRKSRTAPSKLKHYGTLTPHDIKKSKRKKVKVKSFAPFPIIQGIGRLIYSFANAHITLFDIIETPRDLAIIGFNFKEINFIDFESDHMKMIRDYYCTYTLNFIIHNWNETIVQNHAVCLWTISSTLVYENINIRKCLNTILKAGNYLSSQKKMEKWKLCLAYRNNDKKYLNLVLKQSVQEGLLELTAVSLNSGADPYFFSPYTIWNTAVKSGNFELFQYIDENTVGLIEQKKMVIAEAVNWGYSSMVDFLINKYQYTPEELIRELNTAARKGFHKIVESLIKYIINKYGRDGLETLVRIIDQLPPRNYNEKLSNYLHHLLLPDFS